MSDTQAALEARVMDVEIKLSYMEDLVDQLNMTIYRQQQTVDLLLEEVRNLRRQSAPAEGAALSRNLRDELPPHY